MLLALAVISSVFLLSAVSVHARPIAYKDVNGVWKVMDEKDWPQVPKAKLQTSGAVIRPSATKIAFTLTFADVALHNGTGFDHPTEGANRRAVIQSVVEYIDSVLNHTGGGCQIEFRVSENESGSSTLASAGPVMWVTNGDPGDPDVFSSGFAFEHITTGVDPSPVDQEGKDAPDVSAIVNFGHSWYTGAVPVPSDKMDLFSVMLHELSHGLGVLSISKSDGASDLGGKTFSYYDNLLYTGNGNKLWDPGANFNGNSSWLVGGDGGIRFRGTNATATFGSYPPIYAPNPWQDGSSIAHWNTGIIPTPVMNYNIGSGVSRRAYQPFEVSALKDLGYTTISQQADINVTPASLDFGQWYWGAPPTGPRTVLIENKGASVLEFTGDGITITGANQSEFQINPSAATTPLASGASRTVSICFDPVDSSAKTALLRITTNDPAKPTVDVPLSGTGTERMPAAAGKEWIWFR
jgi:hypothetical protein